jgi:hypothetical protein
VFVLRQGGSGQQDQHRSGNKKAHIQGSFASLEVI